MNDHQHAAIERARIAWHDHQFEHDCYGLDCAEDRRLYRAYQHAIHDDPAETGSVTRPPGPRPRGRAGTGRHGRHWAAGPAPDSDVRGGGA